MESLVYSTLLQTPGVTAYRIAKTVGKSQTSVTFALRSLEEKRAVAVSTDLPATYDPVAVSALMLQLSHNFSERLESATAALSQIESAAVQDRIRRLVSTEEVFEQADAMLRRANQAVIGIASDWTYIHIVSSLRKIGRGRSAVIMTFSDQKPIKGVRVVCSRRADQIKAYASAELLVLVVDASEMLISIFSPEGELRQAIWSNNSLLVGLFHNGIVSDIILNTETRIDQIRSPNQFLLGMVPTALAATFQ